MFSANWDTKFQILFSKLMDNFPNKNNLPKDLNRFKMKKRNTFFKIFYLNTILISNLIFNLISNLIFNLISNLISNLIFNIISYLTSNLISYLTFNLISYLITNLKFPF